jgi:hypothetical protein
MGEYVALHAGPPSLKAWLHPADCREVEGEPELARSGGWRILIAENVEPPGREPIRSTWEPTLLEAIRHMSLHWPNRPVWRDAETGEVIDLSSFEKEEDWAGKDSRSEGG